MSSPLMKLVCVETISVVRRAAHLFTTQRTSTRRATCLAVLPCNRADFLCRLISNIGAVVPGGFSLFHGRTLRRHGFFCL